MGWIDSLLGEASSVYSDSRDSLASLSHDVGKDAISRGDVSTAMDSATLESSLSNDSWGD